MGKADERETMTIESKQYDALAILTAIFVLAYVGGAVYGVATAVIAVQEYLAVIGTPALPLFGCWVKARQ